MSGFVNVCVIFVLYGFFILLLRHHTSDGIHFATCFIFFISIFAASENPDAVKEVESWKSWFDYFKRISLLLGWLALIAIKILNNHQYAINTWWFLLAFNTCIAGLRALQDYELIGFVIILIALFTPPMFEEHGFLTTERVSSFWQYQITTKYWFRLYYILVGLWNFFGKISNERDSQIFHTLTTLIPLLLSELYPEDNQVHIFMIRVFSMIWFDIMLIFINSGFFSVLSFYTFETIQENSLKGAFTRNACEIASFVFVLIILEFTDRKKVTDDITADDLIPTGIITLKIDS